MHRLKRNVQAEVEVRKTDDRIKQGVMKFELEIPRFHQERCHEFSIEPNEPNFGVVVNSNSVDLIQLLDPLKFDATLNWSISQSEPCPVLGCPMVDTRERLQETLKFKVDLRWGEDELQLLLTDLMRDSSKFRALFSRLLKQ